MTQANAIQAFKIGQVYACLSERPERRLEVTVGRIDDFENVPRIVSVAIRDQGAEGPFAIITHAPFEEDALRTSCASLVRAEAQAPDGFEEGYETWRAAYDAGESGYFTVSIEKLVDLAAAAAGTGERIP